MVPILWRQKLRQQARWLHLVSQGRLSYRQWPEDQVSPSDRVSVLQAQCLGGHGREGKRTKQKREGNDEQLLTSSRKPACASIIISGLP